MKKAGAYIRVSTEEQARGGVSMEMQEAKIRAYCRVYDLDPVVFIHDPGVSAKDIKNRKQVQTLFKMARDGGIEGIIVYKLDRLFRNRIDALVTEEEFREGGIALHSVTEHIDTTSAMGRHIFTIIVSQAAFERELIAERTRDALRHRKAAGQVYNHIPYGWDVVGGELVPNKFEQGVISFVLGCRGEGWTYQQIADHLNGKDVPTKGFGGKNKPRVEGSRWFPQTVKNTMMNSCMNRCERDVGPVFRARTHGRGGG